MKKLLTYITILLSPGFSQFDKSKMAYDDLGPHVASTPRGSEDRFLSQADVEVIASNDPSLVGLEFAKRIDWFVKNTNSKNNLNVGDTVQTVKPFTMNRKRMPLMTLKVKNIRQHGMIATATKQLTLLNKVFEVYPVEAKKALQRMGMVDEEGFAISESFLINTEFVDETESGGAANLIKYGMEQPVKFLAFHGLIEIRPDPKARADFISNYPTYTINQGDVGNALNELTDLIENANKGSGWEFFDASRYRVGLDDNIAKISVSEALSQKITINLNSRKIQVNGGRYDNLISDLGSSKKIPAVGGAISLND